MVNPPPDWEPPQDQSFRSRFNQMRQDPRIQQAAQDVWAAHRQESHSVRPG